MADLGLTSIDRLELVSFLEQEYRLDIEDSQIGPQTRVSDLRQIIAKREKLTRRDHFRFWTNARFFRGVRMAWDALFHDPLFRSFVTLEVRGIEKLEKLDGPVFFVANHLSYLDQPAIMFALPPKIRYRTATAAWEEFFFGEYHGFNRIWRRLSYEYASVLFNLFPLPQSQGFSGSLSIHGKARRCRHQHPDLPGRGAFQGRQDAALPAGTGYHGQGAGDSGRADKNQRHRTGPSARGEVSETGQGDGNLRRAAAFSLRGAGRDRGKDAPGGGETMTHDEGLGTN